MTTLTNDKTLATNKQIGGWRKQLININDNLAAMLELLKAANNLDDLVICEQSWTELERETFRRQYEDRQRLCRKIIEEVNDLNAGIPNPFYETL